MTSGLAGPRAIYSERRRFWIVTTPQENPRRALGKGLGALLPTRVPPATMPPAPDRETASRIAIDLIDPTPVQPRRVFEAEALQQLADSIVQHGIIQPLV